MATSSASLDRSPGKNWVEESGGLPPGIRKVARKLKKLYPSWSLERCIATAQSMSEKWAAKGSVKGARNVAGMQALRARNKARMAGKTVAASNPVLPHLELHLSNSYGPGTITIPAGMLRESPADPLAVAMDQLRGSIFDLAQPADVAEWLDLAERRVRTQAGVERFNKPIGAVITRSVRAPKVRTGADFVRAARKAQATRQAKVSAAADRISGLDAKTRAGVLSKASPQHLAAMDQEFTRRATELGKAGQVSKTHQAVKDARAALRKPSAERKPTGDDRLAKLTPAQREAVLAARAKHAQQRGTAPLPRIERATAGTAEAQEMIRQLQVGGRTPNEQARREALADAAQRRGLPAPASAAPIKSGDTVTAPGGTGQVYTLVRKNGIDGANVKFPGQSNPRWIPLSSLRKDDAGAAQRAENDRQARALNLPGADGGRPKPDMSNVQGLSDDDLDARIAQAKTDLRKAFEQDPRRSSQGFKDAKLNADVLAAEKRRRNEADHNTRGQGKVSGVTTPTPTTSTPPARITPEQIQAGAPTPEIGKLGQDIANSRGAAMAQLLEGKNLEELRAADREMARRAEVLGRPGQVSPAHHALKKELAKKEADQAASDRIRADFERRVELGRTQTAAQPEQRAPSAAEQRITAERQAQQAIDARLTAIENRFRAMTLAQRKAAHDALMAERPKGMKQDAVLRRGQIRLELNVLERIAREKRDPRPAGKAPAADSGGAPDAAIRDVYAQLAPEPGRWVGLTDLRRELSARGMSRQQVDKALEEMASTPGVHVSSEPNTKALTDADRAAAVRFGGTDRHMLMIEPDGEPDPWGPSGPPSGAVREQRAQGNRSALRAQGRAENDEWLAGGSETDAAEGFARARRASQDPRKVRGTAENITAHQQARAAAASQPSMFAGTADEQRMADTEVRRTPARAPSLFDQPAEPERTPTVRAAEQEAQRAREAADDLPAHLTGDQRQMLTKQRQAADKAWAAARKVFDETGENPDAAAKRRRNRAAQKAADARDLYDRTAEAYGAPKLPPLQRSRPAGPRPRSTDEAAITAAKQELAEASQRAAANFNQRGGTLGGKKAKQITDARLRRSTEYGQKADRAKARLRALGVPEAEIEETVNAAWSR